MKVKWAGRPSYPKWSSGRPLSPKWSGRQAVVAKLEGVASRRSETGAAGRPSFQNQSAQAGRCFRFEKANCERACRQTTFGKNVGPSGSEPIKPA